MDPHPGFLYNDANSKDDVPLDHILDPSSVRNELEQLMQVSGEWEMMGFATEAGVGVKVSLLVFVRGSGAAVSVAACQNDKIIQVDIEDIDGVPGRVVVMSAQFKTDSNLRVRIVLL